MNRMRVYILMSLVTLLTACGGGGGSEDAVDRYVGNWRACVAASGAYAQTTLGLSKTGAGSGVMVITVDNLYADAACTVVTAVASVSISSTFNIVGTKVIDGNTVDKVDIVYTGSSAVGKDVLFTSGNALYIGAIAATDAAGYPTALSQPFIKQ